MLLHPFATFSKSNRRLIFLLIVGHLLWCLAVLGLCSLGSFLDPAHYWWSGLFIAVQLYAAAQLFLPVLLFHPEERTRSFYFFWGLFLSLSIWLINRITVVGNLETLLFAIKSGLLLLVATVIGAVLARYVNRLWEIVPVCMVMSLADLASWRCGPTAKFTQEIEQYYLEPEGVPPLIDMVLVKLALPGQVGLVPVFGISDWIMVVFFVVVAGRYGINDNLVGLSGKMLAEQRTFGRYLPVSVVALFIAILFAQVTGLFIPALPLVALIVLLWYATGYLLQRHH